jgi:N-acetylneuraminate synthase
MPEFKIATIAIGRDQPPFVIAEAGVHHYGSVESAKTYIGEAAAAGAQAIKFQTYTADKLVTTWAELYWDDPRYKTQYDVFKEKPVLGEAVYAELMAHAANLGIVFLSTPFDVGSASMLAGLGMAAFKIASADLTNLPLIRHVAGFGKPILLSTGASLFAEIETAVRAIQEFHGEIALLHCSLAYPTPLKDANLKRIDALTTRFPDCVIGYSDHTLPQESELACPLAVARGARVIEKHFTLDRSLPGDDHYHAVDPQGLKRLVVNCANAVLLGGTGAEMTDVEQAARRSARRSIVAARPLPRGTVLAPSDLDYKRPGHGLSPADAQDVIGKRLKCDVAYDALITLDLLD